MNQDLKGSESRDTFKQLHKRLQKDFYACDLDFVLVTKQPKPGIVAILDYKKENDSITFSEVLAYNDLLSVAPIYIITSDGPESGPFKVQRYMSGDYHRPDVVLKDLCVCADWEALGKWERGLREWRAVADK